VNMWLVGAWGAAGGLVVELLDFYHAVRRAHGLPWKKDPDEEPGPAALAIAGITRVLIGAVVATAMGSVHQVSGALGGLGAGIAAPLLINQLGQFSGQSLPASGPVPAPLPADGETDD
jgi:hypothetical protein